MNGTENLKPEIESRIAQLEGDFEKLQRESIVSGHGQIIGHGKRFEVDKSMRLTDIDNRISSLESSVKTIGGYGHFWGRDTDIGYIFPDTLSDDVIIGSNGTVTPASMFELLKDDGHPILTITGKHATNYDPQTQFRTGATPTVKFSMGVDGADDKFKIFSGTGIGGTSEFVIDTSGNMGIGVAANAANKLEVAGLVRMGDAGANTFQLEVVKDQDAYSNRILIQNVNNHATSEAHLNTKSNVVQGKFGSYPTLYTAAELRDKTIAYSTKDFAIFGVDSEVQIYVGGYAAGNKVGTFNSSGYIPSNAATIHVIAQDAAPTSTTAGALWLDTNASANGDLMCYGNGAWRKVISLP